MYGKNVKPIIEALLFIWGEPLNIKDISIILEMDKIKVEKVLNDMIEEFQHNNRGLKIIRIKNNYQLCTKPECDKWISKLSIQNKNKGLSNAALETLSIIAYKQPITRNEMEEIRGVRCDKAIQTLLEKGLIEEKGRLKKLGRPILYRTTIEFLQYFGLQELKDLPPIQDLKVKTHEFDKKEE